MAGQAIANLVLEELDAIEWGDDPAAHPGKTWPAIAKGLWNYFNDSWTLTTIATGITVVGIVPTPAIEPNVQSTLTIPPKELLLPNLQTLSVGAIPGLFGAINIWLSVPPWPVTATQGGTIVNPITGVSVAMFPTFATMGAACQTTMMVAMPNTKEDAWKIIGDFIYTGISTNMVVPMAVVGTGITPPGPFTGIATSILTWS